MKRRSESEASLRHLKRANSSVFSIATIVEDTSNDDDGDDEARLTRPDEHDFDDDNDDSSGCDKGDELDTSSYLPVLSPSRKSSKNKKSPFADDNATGVIFELSDGHFDKNNRLHKERPLRITSIKEYLARPDSLHNIAQRCKIFGDANVIYKCEGMHEKMIATEVDQFLDDEDYLRVHLAGYMQRLDCLSGCSCTDRLDREAEQYQSIYFAPGTVSAAKNAAYVLNRVPRSITSR